MQAIRMLAIDLDGTLLRNDNTVSDYTREVLLRAQKAGVRVVIATGRMFTSARRVAIDLGLGDVPLISYSGGLIAKCESGEVLFHQPIPLATANEVLAAARELDSCVQVYVQDRLYVEAYNERVAAYEKQCRISATPVGERLWHLTEAPTKIIFNETDPEKMAEIRKVMPARLAGKVNFLQSSAVFFEMVAPHVSKGIAMEQLGLRYGIPLAETMAFGNADNDIGMLRAAGWPVAVANAIPQLREMAWLVAPSNEEDGVAKTVAQYVLGE